MSSVVLRSIASTHGEAVGAWGESPMARVDADMRHVLNILATLEPKPIEAGSPTEARAQPTLTTALGVLLRGRGDDEGASMELRIIHGPAGDIRARVYRPAHRDIDAKLPMILYLHGGGWVTGDLDTFDATPRALAARCNAVVVSSHYRQAPEFKFPAAHEDALAAWVWMIGHAQALGGDPKRSAIVGEDAGANMAVDVALAARDSGGARPKHLVLVTPMAGTDFSLPSYADNEDSSPLGAAGARWLYKKATRNSAAMLDPRLNLIDRGDLGGLPPTTVILAGIDPLLSEGELLADALRRCGVWVDSTVYDGVTHGFLGLARVVNKAMFAQAQVARNLKASFA